MHQNSSSYFILFSLPKITVRADAIEFIDEEASGNGSAAPAQPVK